MKVSGFSFIRNAIKFDYPIIEAITSILPICDEFIIAVGNSDDDTLNLIKNINSDKIKIIETTWDDSLREGGKVLAVETNKAFDAISSDSSWAFYIQGDEVIHEKYLDSIKNAMLQYENNDEVEGLLFDYKHFYGSYDYVATSRYWYRKEIRIVKNNKNIRSYKDAQGFRINDEKLKVKPINAEVYHYGWVKHPKDQQAKQVSFNSLWHNDEWINEKVEKVDTFDYSRIHFLNKFNEKHPAVMEKRIESQNWEFTFDPTKRKIKFSKRVLYFIENVLNFRFGEYKNYKII